MSRGKKTLYIALIIIVLLIIGFYREFVFKNINALIQAIDADMDYEMPSSLNFLSGYQYQTLINIKWVLTIVFAALYLIISMITIKVIFDNQKFRKITMMVFLAVTLLSGIFILLGFLIKSRNDNMYEIARFLMGILQSPIILMLLIPAFKLAEKDI
jgi:hypothetical protein